MPVFANMVLTIMLKYDHVLDPIMLKNAMVELVDRDGWRKLGARLKYEVHKNSDFALQNRN